MKSYKFHQFPLLLSWWVGRKFRYSFWLLYHKFCGRLKFVKIGKNVKFNGRVRVEHPYSNITIGSNTMIGKHCYFLSKKPGSIIIGENVGINDGCYITSCYGIKIGRDVRIAEYVSIRDYDHEFTSTLIPIHQQGLTGDCIEIQDGVWIGRGVMITSGVKIGEGAVIGANAVVTKNIPAWSVAAGVPAKVLRMRNHST